MDVEFIQLESDMDCLKKATSFENLILFALKLSADEKTVENTHPVLIDIPSNIIQESDHEIRLVNVTEATLETRGIGDLLYRALTCAEVKKMLTSNPHMLTLNNCLQSVNKIKPETYLEARMTFADDELGLDNESEEAWKSFVNVEIEALVPRRSEEDTPVATIKHVIITENLKFFCKLCSVYIKIYEDLFSHLNSTLHHILADKEERRLDFVYHQDLLRKVRRVRELLAEEGDHIAILQGESYNCKLCDKFFTSEADMFVHITTLKHQLLKVRTEKMLHNGKGLGRLLEQNKILKSSAVWNCMVCNADFIILPEAVMHIKKEAHKENLVRQNKENRCDSEFHQLEPNELFVDLKNKQIKEINICVDYSLGEQSRNSDKISHVCSEHFHGENRSIIKELLESNPRLPFVKENDVLQNEVFDEEYKYLLYMCKGIFFCKLCTTFVSAYGVDYHVYSKLHSQVLEEKTITLARLWFIIRLLEQGNFGNIAVDGLDPFTFHCRLCSIRYLQMVDVLPHVAGKDHMANLRLELVRYCKLSQNELMCRICNTVLQSDEYVFHVYTESHQAAFACHISKLQQRQKQQKLFQILPYILNVHEEYFKPISDSETRCMLCKCNVGLATDDIWAHINDSYHVSHMNFSLQKMLSYEMQDEGKGDENLEIAPNVIERDTNDVVSDDFSQIEAHCKSNVQGSNPNRHDFSIDVNSSIYSKLCVIPQNLKTGFASHRNFKKHCIELCGLSDNAFLEAQNLEIISMLEVTFRPVFPECNVIIFGSRLAGFAVHSNDIDVYIDVGSSKLRSHEHYMTQRLFVRMGYRLLSARHDCRNLKEVPYARTPIIRFTYVPLGIDCDLNFMNDMSVQNTKLLRFYSTLDERVKMLILLVRHWAKTTGVTRLGTSAKISNYALTLLVIFYLQQLDDPVVPTVEFLQSHYVGDKKSIRGWNCSFTEDPSAIPLTRNKASTMQLLQGFFQFYACMKFSQVVLCPQHGLSTSRREFVRLMGQQQMRDGQPEKFRIKSPMCVQDPLDLSHNVTKGVTSKCLSVFQLTCQAYAHLID